jgi:hypothetical protein
MIMVMNPFAVPRIIAQAGQHDSQRPGLGAPDRPMVAERASAGWRTVGYGAEGASGSPAIASGGGGPEVEPLSVLMESKRGIDWCAQRTC